MKPLVLKVHFTGKSYRAIVRIGKLDTQVTHLPVRGETMKDIHEAMIQQAKDIIVKNATT